MSAPLLQRSPVSGSERLTPVISPESESELKGLRNLVHLTIAQMGKLRPRGQASRHQPPACGSASTSLPMC